MEAYVGCVAGALEQSDYLARLEAVGFKDASIEPTRRYKFSDLDGSWAPQGVPALTEEEKLGSSTAIYGGFIRAVKP